MRDALTVIEAHALQMVENGQPVFSGMYAKALRRVANDLPAYVTIQESRATPGRASAAHFTAQATARGLAAARALLEQQGARP